MVDIMGEPLSPKDILGSAVRQAEHRLAQERDKLLELQADVIRTAQMIGKLELAVQKRQAVLLKLEE